MEQVDGMSSVRWDNEANDEHHEPEPMPQYTANGTNIPTFSTHPANRPKDAEDERSKLTCQVSNPNREAVGSRESYISYLVTTHSTLPVFSRSDFKVRRRYNDFVFLHNALQQQYPACAVPPLPDRHASAYIKGGRFDGDFVNRRSKSRGRFLARCALHPQLKRATELHTFLESSEWNAYTKTHAHSHHARRATMDGGSSMIDGLTDTLMGAFTGLAKADKRFLDIKERSDKLARDLGHIEKLVGKIIRRETDIEIDLEEMSHHFSQLADIEPELETEFKNFAAAMHTAAESFHGLKEDSDISFLTFLHDQIAYNGAIKNLLKARDQKQVDFEQLTEYQLKSTLERDQLASGYSSANFIQARMENFRGLNHEQVRKDKLKKAEVKVEDLQRETDAARLVSENFDDQVIREVEIFERTKAAESKQSMKHFAKANIDFYKKIIHDWEGLAGSAETT